MHYFLFLKIHFYSSFSRRI